MKKIISLVLVAVLCFGLTTVALANEGSVDKEAVEKQRILKEYDKEYKELEKEIKKQGKILKENGKLYKKDPNKLHTITKTVKKEKDVVATIAIVYSYNTSVATTSGDDIVDGGTFTHCKLYIGTNISLQSGGDEVTLDDINGCVVEIYDGATCEKIVVDAGQTSTEDPFNSRTEGFTYTVYDYYDESFNWPWLTTTSLGFRNIGQVAKFYIKRGDTQIIELAAQLK